MSGILTDDHLESLQCTRCHKYLSVFPVKNHSNREVTCGRCSSEDDGGVRSILYELIAEKYLFRCVNRYEGCRKLLRADETVAHEKVCLGNAFRCPKCDDRTDRSALELIWHYKLGHPSSYLKKNRFEARQPRDDAMLYVRNNVLFVVLLRFGADELRLSAVTLSAIDATQMFFVMREGTVLNRVEEKRCKSMSSFDGDYFVVRLEPGGPIEVIFNVEVSRPNEPYSISNNVNSSSDQATAGEILLMETVVSESDDEPPNTVEESGLTPNGEQFMRPLLIEPLRSFSGCHLNDSGTGLVNANGVELDLTCSNCKQLIGLPIYQCNSSEVKHNICHSCRFWCGLCNCTVTIAQQKDTSLGQVSSYLKYPCKWRCGRYFTTDIRNHESACERRIKECPECSLKIHFEFMDYHLQIVHEVFFCKEFIGATIRRCFEKDRTGGTVYFLLNDKWCYVKYSQDNTQRAYHGYSISIQYKVCLDFFSVDEKLNTKLKIINGSSVLHPTGIRLEERILLSFSNYSYMPYLDFNAS